MNEIYEIVVPIIRSKTPPKHIAINKMVAIVTKKVENWVKTLSPKFTSHDVIEMAKFKQTKSEIQLTYKTIRNKKRRA